MLTTNTVIDGPAFRLDSTALPASGVDDGEPRTDSVELLRSGAIEIGIWEIAPGVATDTETDEVFVVLSGRARVDIEGQADPLELRAGTVGRLAAGARTRWTVTETLRKVYVLGTV